MKARVSDHEKHRRREKRRKRRRDIRKLIFATICAFIVMLFATGMTLTTLLMRQKFGRVDYPPAKYTYSYRYSHYKDKYPREKVSFKSGKNTLHGYIYGNGNNDKGVIIFAHGIGAGHENYMTMLVKFVDRGWKVFAYDATASCTSEGRRTKGLAQSAIDLDKALDFAESDSRLKDLPHFVMGHSWGGFAAAAVLNFDHDVKACVTLSGYCDPMTELIEASEVMLGGEQAKYMSPFIWIYNKIEFGKYSSLSAVDGINKAGIPVLVVHGTNDKTVRYDGAAIINQQDRITKPNVEYLTMDKKRRKGHNSYLYSAKTIKYIRKKLDPEFNLLLKQYNGNIPDRALIAFYKSVDKELANGINTELLKQVNEFFEAQLDAG